MTQREMREHFEAQGFKFEYIRQRTGGYKYHKITDTLNQNRLNPKEKEMLWDMATACEGHHYGFSVENVGNDCNTMEICIYID